MEGGAWKIERLTYTDPPFVCGRMKRGGEYALYSSQGDAGQVDTQRYASIFHFQRAAFHFPR